MTGKDVANITIHNLDEALKSRLRTQAAVHGRSMEEEARDILSTALGQEPSRKSGLFTSIRAKFAKLGGIELPILAREPMRAPPSFEE